MSTDDPPSPAPPKDDLALVVGASEDASALAVLRKRGEEVEAAVLRRAEEGAPLHGELVRLTPRQEPLLFDVETLYAPKATRPARAAEPPASGPPQVATRDYRKGWSRTFGAGAKRSRTSN